MELGHCVTESMGHFYVRVTGSTESPGRWIPGSLGDPVPSLEHTPIDY